MPETSYAPCGDLSLAYQVFGDGPGPRIVMRPADRAVAVMARRTPWILRGMARLAPATGRSLSRG